MCNFLYRKKRPDGSGDKKAVERFFDLFSNQISCENKIQVLQKYKKKVK